MSSIISFTPNQIALIKQTVAKGTTDAEFDLYIEMCKARGLNPLLRHAFAQIFSANDPKKRQMVIVVSREGQRSIAERTGCYRPDSRAPRYVQEEGMVGPSNPAGLVSAEVSIYKHSHGEWHEVPEIVYWEEFAPLKEIWENDAPTGRYFLDPKKDAWKRMPRVMLAKCFSSDTEVLTSLGFQKFSELNSPVMQVTDHGLEPVMVEAWSQFYAGDMVTLDSDDLNFCVTPNHEMVTTAGRIEAKTLYDEARARPVHFIPRSAQGRRIDADIDDNALVLAAAYLSDGCDRTSNSFVISISREKKIAKLCDIDLHTAERTEIAAGNIAKTYSRDIVTKSNKKVFSYKFASMGGLCLPGKNIDTEFLISLSERQARIFIESWIFFDGTVTPQKTSRFYCSNEVLIGMFELAACLAGKSVSYRRSRITDMSKRINYSVSISDRDAIPVIRWGRDYNNISKNNERGRTGLYTKTNHDNIIWCVSVPSQTIIVRRNGFSMICGNCSEMAALRKAFPDTFGGLYADAEIDRREVLDLTPSEAVESAGKSERLKRLGGASAVIVDWLDGNALERVLDGQFTDRVMAFLRTCEDAPSTACAWRDRNRHALAEFWARCPAEALEIKKVIEKLEAAQPCH